MNADVMSRDMLVASCLALLDQVATEHPAGHQGKLSARFIIRSRSGERVGLMFEKGGRTKPYLWAALAHASDLLEADVEFRVYLASSLYQDACSTGWRASIPRDHGHSFHGIAGSHSTGRWAASHPWRDRHCGSIQG